jgi:Carboxypeptidase regulatory-like domain
MENEIKRKQTNKKVDKPAAIDIDGCSIVGKTFKIKGEISSDESWYLRFHDAHPLLTRHVLSQRYGENGQYRADFLHRVPARGRHPSFRRIEPVCCRKQSSVRSQTLALLFLALAFSCMPLHAQTVDTAIVGTVADSTGAVISGANVTGSSQTTGIKKTVVTASGGEYCFAHLTAGNYDITVSAQSLGLTANCQGYTHLSRRCWWNQLVFTLLQRIHASILSVNVRQLLDLL